jgi:trimethylguanosine synthase
MSAFEYQEEGAATADEKSNTKKKKKKAKKNKKQPPPEVAEPHMQKYWAKRYQLFSKFDQGIKLDQGGKKK